VPELRASYDLAVFDIDGTLLATDVFWLSIGRRGVSEVYARHGIERAIPPDSTFLGAIGLAMRDFWKYVLPEDLHSLVEEVEQECQELEKAAFAGGLGAMYPGARGLLGDLHTAGLEVALASNCGRRYLEGFIEAFDLGPILAAARCVDSPGMRSKADMVRDILADTGASRPVMVGDRDGDRQAALANRIPFVLFTGGFLATRPRPGDRVARNYEEVRRFLLPV
jgi:phosphoglycolate phosphatase-like HAD superfamily hydrolase